MLEAGKYYVKVYSEEEFTLDLAPAQDLGTLSGEMSIENIYGTNFFKFTVSEKDIWYIKTYGFDSELYDRNGEHVEFDFWSSNMIEAGDYYLRIDDEFGNIDFNLTVLVGSVGFNTIQINCYFNTAYRLAVAVF